MHGSKLNLQQLLMLVSHLSKPHIILEGEGPLALKCHEVVSTLTVGILVQHYPNLHAVAQKLVTFLLNSSDYGRCVLHLDYSILS